MTNSFFKKIFKYQLLLELLDENPPLRKNRDILFRMKRKNSLHDKLLNRSPQHRSSSWKLRKRSNETPHVSHAIFTVLFVSLRNTQ